MTVQENNNNSVRNIVIIVIYAPSGPFTDTNNIRPCVFNYLLWSTTQQHMYVPHNTQIEVVLL